MKNKIRLISLVAICVLLISACSPVAVTKVSSYTIASMHRVKIHNRSKTRLTLLVTSPSANPGYQSSSMIYMKTPYKLSTYSVNRWVAPPAEMLLPLFVQNLRSKGFYKAVVSPPFSGTARLRLDTRVLNFQQEFFSSVSRVRVVVQASLYSNATGRVKASRRFEAVEPAPSNNPYGGVLAANKAAGKISRQIASFCVRYSH